MFVFILHTAITGLKDLTLFSICSSHVRKDDTLTLNNYKPIPPAATQCVVPVTTSYMILLVSMAKKIKHVACVDGTSKICCG